MKLPGKRGKDAIGTSSAASVEASAQSEEVLRTRARRRLIGAVVLVLTGVVVFPLIFETQPKPVASSMSLVIPSQDKATIMAPPAASVPAAEARAAAAVADSAARGSGARPDSTARPEPSANSQTVQAMRAQVIGQEAHSATPDHAHAPSGGQTARKEAAAGSRQKTEPIAAAVSTNQLPHDQERIAGARVALAALEGKKPDQISNSEAQAALAKSSQVAGPSGTARYVIQAGAYSDTRTAHEVRQKLEHAGIKTYTQVVDTEGGKRIRVRVGPFASRQQAEQVLSRIKALGLSAVVLSL